MVVDRVDKHWGPLFDGRNDHFSYESISRERSQLAFFFDKEHKFSSVEATAWPFEPPQQKLDVPAAD